MAAKAVIALAIRPARHAGEHLACSQTSPPPSPTGNRSSLARSVSPQIGHGPSGEVTGLRYSHSLMQCPRACFSASGLDSLPSYSAMAARSLKWARQSSAVQSFAGRRRAATAADRSLNCALRARTAASEAAAENPPAGGRFHPQHRCREIPQIPEIACEGSAGGVCGISGICGTGKRSQLRMGTLRLW
jgi:hypothetical protein